ncbi:MAG: prolyl oligopeptidase family serine peptidase [Flavobacterium sp.]
MIRKKTISVKDFSCLIIFVLTACSVMGQAKQRKLLTPADYHLWSILESPAISGKGGWVSYNLRYASGLDTLFVQSTSSKRRYSFPLGSSGKFCGEQWYACTKGNSAFLCDLNTGKQEFYAEIQDFEFSGNGKYLLLFSRPIRSRKNVIIRNLFDGSAQTIENISCWSLNATKDKLAYGIADKGIVISFKNTIVITDEIDFTEAIASNVVWQNNGDSIVFVTESEESKTANKKLALYRFADKRLMILNPNTVKGFSGDKHIFSPDLERLKISDDGMRVFFQEVPNKVTAQSDKPLVEVWHGDDKILYSEQQQYGEFKDWAKTAVWFPDSNEVFEFMPNETHVKLSGDQRYALTSSIEPCELQFKYSPDRDFYLTNLITKERQPFLKCHSPEMQHTLMSPGGKYIVYHKDGDWYAYGLATGEHRNLTRGISSIFYDEANDIGEKPDAYGLAGFSNDDQSIFIYDKYDLWEVTLGTSSARRITNGREQNIIFRIAKTSTEKQLPFDGTIMSDIIDLNSLLVLKASLPDESVQGFYAFKNDITEKLVFTSKRIYEIRKAGNADTYIFLQEDYQHPTSLQLITNNRSKTIFQSNPQQSNYFIDKVTAINYLSESGKPLKALLYYPSEYKKGNKYPMAVYVYQTQSDRLHYYRNPADPVYNGYSVPNFVNRGYFVLMPDIEYKMGSPGDSAVFCVTAAVNEALKTAEIDGNKLGLIGHSLGGFESTYIITKSNLFAAAVAGASMTDHVSGYLTVSENYKKAEIWRFEYYTNRMGKPLFENFMGYLENSAVYNAPNIITPLLLWTGEKDKHIASSQSMELFLAMRRLGKKVTLLKYPNEDHNLEIPENQADLSNKVLEWFDYYLKDGKQFEWMETK